MSFCFTARQNHPAHLLFQEIRLYYKNVQSGAPGVKEINSFHKQKGNMGKKLVSFIKMASKLNFHLTNPFQEQKENMGKKHASFIKMASN
jgi:hypothetical protein